MTLQNTDGKVLVTWLDCSCDWTTKLCYESHQRSAYVPDAVLRQYS